MGSEAERFQMEFEELYTHTAILFEKNQKLHLKDLEFQK